MHRASSGPRRWIIWLAIVVPVVLIIAVGAYGALASPGCDSCHAATEFVAATEAAPHATVTCGACHAPSSAGDRLLFGYRQVGHMVFPLIGEGGREWAAVPDVRCTACHEGIENDIVTARGLRVDHSVCAEGFSCTDCHSTVAHGIATSWIRTYDMETCLECHVSDTLADCTLCHEGRLSSDRITTGVFAITHGPEWEQTHGMGNSATCSACHTAADCATCHGPGLPHGVGFVTEHAEYSRAEDAQCLGCHETRYCDDCHGLDMPHPQQFVVEHAVSAREDEVLCARCHAESDCIVCHETHVHPGGSIGLLSQDGNSR